MKEEKRCPGHTCGVYIMYFYIHMWLSVLIFPLPAHQCAMRWNAAQQRWVSLYCLSEAALLNRCLISSVEPTEDT